MVLAHTVAALDHDAVNAARFEYPPRQPMPLDYVGNIATHVLVKHADAPANDLNHRGHQRLVARSGAGGKRRWVLAVTTRTP